MATRTTGIDDANHVPVGATLTRVYHCQPGHGTLAKNGEHDTYAAALTVAVEALRTALDAAPADSLLPETITIDTRWAFKFPESSRPAAGLDTVARRTTYDTLADAVAHLDRVATYTGTGV